jgi:hypothetical protein
MHINRADIEIIVQTIISERLADIAESMKQSAYYQRDHGGSLERGLANVFDDIEQAIKNNIGVEIPFKTRGKQP